MMSILLCVKSTSRLSASVRCVATKASPKLQLYSYGDGYLGTLGQDNFDSLSSPKLVKSLAELDLTKLSCGWSHTGVLDANGSAYVFGRTHHFRSVIRAINMHRMVPFFMKFINTVGGEQAIEAFRPIQVDIKEPVRDISCGAALTLYLTESGALYSNGGNAYGQCGTKNESSSVWEPTKINIPGKSSKVASMAAGFQHALAATKEGQVYTWGKGERGQLGFGTVNVSAPQHIVALRQKKVVKVGAGFNHSVALTDAGELFIWGKLLGADVYGRKTGSDQITPRLVQTAAPVSLMKSSFFHTFVVTDDGKLWCMGRSQASQQTEVANRKYADTHITPLAIDNSFLNNRKIIHLGGGINSTTIVTDDGKVYEWTWELGLQPLEVTKGLDVVAYERGYGSNMVLARN
ncbi:hypothetical protein THRCLA_03927 [Thraustotheca clavata]|uniref:RCC1-like domain-containing protein n=1 Tax=Thraustotheca clavata TaxID=74557 RepID=A0A1W0A0J8_9STRA|nr:hypothetical protein THRCLA_03927 [Thraustotheca clavata]